MATRLTRITRKPHMSITIHWEIDAFAHKALWLVLKTSNCADWREVRPGGSGKPLYRGGCYREVGLMMRFCCAQLAYIDRAPGEPYNTNRLEILVHMQSTRLIDQFSQQLPVIVVWYCVYWFTKSISCYEKYHSSKEMFFCHIRDVS